MSSQAGRVFYLGLLLLSSTMGDASNSKDGSVREDAYRRQRRSLMDLSSMVSEVTGKQSKDFISYGNWCGLGGAGHPVDPIDECCQIHDFCYDLANKGSCRDQGEKVAYQVEYKWSKTKDDTASCDDEPEKCKSTVCLCDAMLTNCLKSNLESYDSQNLHKLSLYELLQEANWIAEP